MPPSSYSGHPGTTRLEKRPVMSATPQDTGGERSAGRTWQRLIARCSTHQPCTHQAVPTQKQLRSGPSCDETVVEGCWKSLSQRAVSGISRQRRWSGWRPAWGMNALGGHFDDLRPVSQRVWRCSLRASRKVRRRRAPVRPCNDRGGDTRAARTNLCRSGSGAHEIVDLKGSGEVCELCPELHTGISEFTGACWEDSGALPGVYLQGRSNLLLKLPTPSRRGPR